MSVGTLRILSAPGGGASIAFASTSAGWLTTIPNGYEEVAPCPPSTRARYPRCLAAQQPCLLWINGFVARRLRNGGKKTPGFDFDLLLLTTTGRKSGLERTTPVGWVSDGNGGWLIAASANGAASIPAWYHNLAAAPDKTRIEVNGATIPVTAEQLHGSEREAAWQTLTAAIPRFGKYPEKTDREIRVSA